MSEDKRSATTAAMAYMWTLLAVIACIASSSTANHVVLMDTTDSSSLGWTRFNPHATSEDTTQGWLEESYPHYDEYKQLISWRSYVVCDVNQADVNNWLRTPFIERGAAERLYIEVKFSMRDCTHFPATVRSCKETFSLLYYESEFDFADEAMPTWNARTYSMVDRIAADEGRFSDNNEVVINTEVRSVAASKRGVYFAFHDEGACISLLAVRVYYVTCPNITLNHAFFPETPTGREVSSIKQTIGGCVPNAAQSRTPSYLCTGGGQWDLLTGGCECVAGYQAIGQQCEACPKGRYKSHMGNGHCDFCPAHSSSNTIGSQECECETGFYRAAIDARSSPCTRPPSPPRNLSMVFSDQATVMLSWLPPADTGARDDVRYRVACDICGGAIHYVPSGPPEGNISNTSVQLSGLEQTATYKIFVYAENGVSPQSGVSPFTSITVNTAPFIHSRVSGVTSRNLGDDTLLVSWKKPLLEEIDLYEVKQYLRYSVLNVTMRQTMSTNFTFRSLPRSTEYGFQVRARTPKGWGEFSAPVYARTRPPRDTADTGVYDADVQPIPAVGIYAAIAFAAVVMLVACACLSVVCYRRSRKCKNMKGSDCDTLEYRNGEAMAADPITNGITTPLFPPGAPRMYVDPHTYEDPNQAVREFAREIDTSLIMIEAIVGGGEFGDVCKGRLRHPAKGEITCAIKTLKPGASEKARLDFLTEASIMGQFDDANVIYLQGVVTKSNPVMIITEYMENGSLDTFLRTNDGKFQCIQLVGMLRGIASGMKYLSEMNYVHRDLAARNVLVNDSLVCKIADFGLSREIETNTAEGAYTTRGGKIPVRWTAPEAIAFRKFTSASDVWSYGIVMWEVMSYGERPYWNWSNQDVIKAIEKGYRLPAPMDCPEATYQLMLDCWQKERNHRPKFNAIVKTLDTLIRNPETLRIVAQCRYDGGLDPFTPDVCEFTTVHEWLDNIKMGRYIDAFVIAGYTTAEALCSLTVTELTRLGVTLVGHQKKIMYSVQTLRAQLCGAQVAEGFLV